MLGTWSRSRMSWIMLLKGQWETWWIKLSQLLNCTSSRLTGRWMTVTKMSIMWSKMRLCLPEFHWRWTSTSNLMWSLTPHGLTFVKNPGKWPENRCGLIVVQLKRQQITSKNRRCWESSIRNSKSTSSRISTAATRANRQSKIALLSGWAG